jgi:hypothetical protein
MLDILHLPKTGNGNIDYFYNTGGGGSWVTWEKPRGISMIEITCIGAGGGGASGFCSNITFPRCGGGGGASGNLAKLLIDAILLPDVLYVQVGRGGAGGASTSAVNTSNSGSAGESTFVSIAPSAANPIYNVCFANAGLGAPASNQSTGAPGSSAALTTQSSCLISSLGMFLDLQGQSGATGSSANASALAYPTTGLRSGGGAGGGAATANSNGVGGNVTAPPQTSFSFISTRTGGILGTPGTAGDHGLTILQPFMSIGGAGGGGGNSGGSGGPGGNGGIGSGGGGGGTSPTGFNSGAGGKGGDGLVIIQSF